MTLPNDFDPTAHLVSTIQRIYNRSVRDWFQDVGPAEWIPDIATPRSSARVACTHRNDDSLLMTTLRVMLFHFEIRDRHSLKEVGTTNRHPTVIRRSRPQVVLFFQEDFQDVAGGYAPVTGRISFRLMNETTESLGRAEAVALGNRVRVEFGNAGGFVWRKGKHMFSYSDWDKGYQLQLLVRDVAEGRRIVDRVLDIQGHVPNWEYANYSENESAAGAYPTIPPTEFILGETVRLPRRRPIAEVRFQYAALELHGLRGPVCLYDRSGTWATAFVDD